MSKLGTQSVHPTGDQSDYHADSGISYRQWLAGQIASNINMEEVLDSDAGLWARKIWHLTDAVLEEERK